MDKLTIDIDNEEESFTFFLSNLKNITYLNKGTFGLAFILELKDDVESPYKYMDGTQIKKILLKLVGICSLENKDTKQTMTTYTDNVKHNSYDTQTLTANVLEKECMLQKKVYDCGKAKNIQLCPKMFYCNIKTIENAMLLLDTLIKSTGYIKPEATLKNRIKTLFKSPVLPPLVYNILAGLKQNIDSIDELSFSLMEYADGYETIDLSRNKDTTDYARVALLKLALYCGVSHSDPNMRNILINNNNHILLIDFGSTIEDHNKDIITEEEKKNIIDNLKQQKYRQALEICNKFYKPPIYTPPYDPIESEIAWVHKDISSKPNPIIDSFVSTLVSEETASSGGKKSRRNKNKRRLRKTHNKKIR